MSKRLPYFQFEPAEWLAGDIMFCSLSARGLFTDIMALYWQKECKLTIDQVKRRFNCESELEELISEKIIKIENNNIVIEFLDNQLVKAIGRSKTNSLNGSKGGRPKKIKEPNENPNESEKKPNAFNSVIGNESEKKPIREDKIREDNIIDIMPEVPSDVPSNLKLSEVNENTEIKNSKYYKITLGFRDLFLYNCKEFGIKNTKHLTDPDFIKFSNPIRLIIESDGYNVEDLRTVYDYLKNSNNTFWKRQVYSTSGLKDKFDKLIADAHAEQKQAVKTIKKPTLNI